MMIIVTGKAAKMIKQIKQAMSEGKEGKKDQRSLYYMSGVIFQNQAVFLQIRHHLHPDSLALQQRPNNNSNLAIKM